MTDNIRKKLLLALTCLCGASLMPAAFADTDYFYSSSQSSSDFSYAPEGRVIGPGVTEYRSTVTEPVLINNPVTIESKTTEKVTEDIDEISTAHAARSCATKKVSMKHHRRTAHARLRQVASAPKVFRAVKTIERTVEKPVVVERPVLIDRPVDRVIEKPVYIEKRVQVAQPPMVIEKPVVIQRPVVLQKPIVIERKKHKHLLNLKVL